jgi:hypothetical protein
VVPLARWSSAGNTDCMLFALLRSDARRIVWFCLLAAFSALGCQSCCSPEVLKTDEPVACTIDKCSGGDNVNRFGECVSGGCSDDSDCCPGTRCRADINTCFPTLLGSEYECEFNEDCEDPAQTCVPTRIGDRQPLPMCVFSSCGTNAECGFGQTCFRNHCVVNAPCEGGCPTGSVCEIASNTCQLLRDGTDDTCANDCPPGRMKVLGDESLMTGEQCCPLLCDCVPPPALAPSRFGRYARIVATATGPVISAYDAEYGDLVLARFSEDGAFVPPLRYVDGVPLDAPITADTLGARGGISAPGTNVGTHTSITMDGNGRLRVAYRDVDNNGVKLALEDATGQMLLQTIDQASSGTLGEFTDIAVSSTGTIAVSYFAHDVGLSNVTGPATGVKVAVSRTATPTTAADWSIIAVDGRPMPAAGMRPDSTEVPRGRGLFTSVAFDGADVVVASYDSIDGDLRLARVANGVATTSVIDGDGVNGRRDGDVGRFPTIAVDGADLLVVYSDFTRHDVRAWRGPTATPGVGGTYADVDRGIRAGESGKAFVGAGARVAIEGARTALVYQDASNLDLRLATLEGGAWSPTALRTDGPHGFYSDVDVRGGRAYICSVVALLDARGIERSRLQVDVQALP